MDAPRWRVGARQPGSVLVDDISNAPPWPCTLLSPSGSWILDASARATSGDKPLHKSLALVRPREPARGTRVQRSDAAAAPRARPILAPAMATRPNLPSPDGPTARAAGAHPRLPSQTRSVKGRRADRADSLLNVPCPRRTSPIAHRKRRRAKQRGLVRAYGPSGNRHCTPPGSWSPAMTHTHRTAPPPTQDARCKGPYASPPPMLRGHARKAPTQSGILHVRQGTPAHSAGRVRNTVFFLSNTGVLCEH